MKGRIIAAAFAAALAGALVPSGASANHWCNAGTIIPVDAGAAKFYFHDRASVVGTGLVEDGGEGTWLFMENGRQAGLQVGGRAIVEPLNENGSADPCTGSPNSDDIIF